MLQQPIETLSKGFKRRVGLALALLHDPEVLILDEPTDGLDPNQKHQVRTLLADMAKDKAIIISTHILEEVDALCTRAIVIARGRIVADAKPAELEARSSYHNAVTLRMPADQLEPARAVVAGVAGVGRVEASRAGGGAGQLIALPAEPAPRSSIRCAARSRPRGLGGQRGLRRARPPRRGVPPADRRRPEEGARDVTPRLTILRRELAAYFTSPLAYVFIVIFLVLAGGLTFYLGAWLERGQADLQVFFSWHPWLYLFLVPAVGMRLWAEERKTGTIEFLMTQPVTTLQAVLGKFLAAWLFVGIALALTFPIWLTVNYLGRAGQRRDRSPATSAAG